MILLLLYSWAQIDPFIGLIGQLFVQKKLNKFIKYVTNFNMPCPISLSFFYEFMSRDGSKNWYNATDNYIYLIQLHWSNYVIKVKLDRLLRYVFLEIF